eukprot:COSAG02_NODE_6684_length_3421_cov_1.721252_6_plen_250_part_00
MQFLRGLLFTAPSEPLTPRFYVRVATPASRFSVRRPKAENAEREFMEHQIDQANQQVGDLVQDKKGLKRKFIEATTVTCDNGGIPIANFIAQNIDKPYQMIYMPATSHVGPAYNYKTPSILTGQHPKIVLRLDMYEHACKEGVFPPRPDPSDWDESVAGDIDINDHIIIPANAGHQKFCAAVEQRLREDHPYTGMSYIDLLESDCPFYVDEHGVDIWHKGPANDVSDDMLHCDLGTGPRPIQVQKSSAW